ncbi:hypothetical protein KEM54_003703, partial [Ascosphaera aggregata]
MSEQIQGVAESRAISSTPNSIDGGSIVQNVPPGSTTETGGPSKPAEQFGASAPEPSQIPGLGLASGEQPVPLVNQETTQGTTQEQEQKATDFVNSQQIQENLATKDTQMGGTDEAGQTESSHALAQAGQAGTSVDRFNQLTNLSETKEEQKSHETSAPSEGQAQLGTLETTNADTAGDKEEEHPEWETDSSPYESSSSDSFSDDSNSDSEEEYTMLDPEEAARILMSAEGGSDDEGPSKTERDGYPRTANEKPEEIVPIPGITVTPDMRIEMLGNVETIVGNIILERSVLESGSVLCLENLDVIGVVADTLGRVEQPLYTVRFTNDEAVKQHGIEVGKAVFYLYDYSTFVFTEPLKGLKGSDASNFHDEEVGDDEIEFSDDEAEAAYKRAQKQAKKSKKVGGDKARKPRPAPGPSGLRTTETLNYDDGPSQDDGYTPLARPKNYHEM